MDKQTRERPGEIVIRFRDCFSVRYIQSGALFCRFGYALEKEYRRTGTLLPEKRLEHEAFVLNALFSTVAFLETTINELWSDAADNAYFFADMKAEALLQEIGRNVLVLFREARAAQMPLAEVSIHLVSLHITARELRGGAIIFLFPQSALSPLPTRPSL